MSAAQSLNPRAEHVRQTDALSLNVAAAEALGRVLSSGFGPVGIQKMLVSGAGDIKITKDGAVLLQEMRIPVATAALIARTATAQDSITGDGTTECILLISEIMKYASDLLKRRGKPRIIVDGIEFARKRVVEWMEKEAAIPLEGLADKLPDVPNFSAAIKSRVPNWKPLYYVARTALSTKLTPELAHNIAQICVDAVTTVAVANPENPSQPRIDLPMIEIIAMMHRTSMDSRLVRGLVLDHGVRNEHMSTDMRNVRILAANVSLEYEKTEINSSLMYSNAEERARLVASEREFIDSRVRDIIAFKEKYIKEDEHLFLMNEKGIDPIALDMLAKAGISAVRRAKRRNLERVTKACGGFSINTTDFENMGRDPSECLGRADHVYEQHLGEDVFTFIEDPETPQSCTVLIKGPNKHSIIQIKDALRDGLRAVKNAILDGKVLPGAGAFEMAAANMLCNCCDFEEGESEKHRMKKTRAMQGVGVFRDALWTIPQALVQNTTIDGLQSVEILKGVARSGKPAGVDVTTGDPIDPVKLGILDAYRVKHQLIHSSTVIASQLLLVDEILKAGRQLQSHDLPEQ